MSDEGSAIMDRIEHWRINYGLDKSPHELSEFWNNRVPNGALVALKAACEEIERLRSIVKAGRDAYSAYGLLATPPDHELYSQEGHQKLRRWLQLTDRYLFENTISGSNSE